MEKTFDVTSPTVGKVKIDTCQVDLTADAAAGRDLPNSWVGPGYNRSCPGGPHDPLGSGNPGIDWSFPVKATKSQAGTLAMIQLLSVQKSQDGRVCEQAANAADASAFYDSLNKAVRACIGLKAGQKHLARPRLTAHEPAAQDGPLV